MPSIVSPDRLIEEAHVLYREGSYSAAALTWARAVEAGRTLGDVAAAFTAGAWEAEAWRMLGDLRRTLGLLLSLLGDPPPDAPSPERWMAQKELVEVQIAVRPELSRVERRLSDVEALASRQANPAGDLYYYRGQVAFCRGAWKQALGHFARGWHAFDGMRGGATEHDFLWGVFHCCMFLKDRQEAESWRQHLSTSKQIHYEDARVMLRATTLLLSLEVGDPAAVAACIENGCGGKTYEMRGQLFVRGDSLDPLHDPSDPSHPARTLARLERVQNVHSRFDNLLALVDYRLSCLRYTAGLPAVDDLYYRRPDVVPHRISPTDGAKFQRQVRLFGISWRLLKRHARYIDDLLECDWRNQEAESRRNRFDAIVAASTASKYDVEAAVQKGREPNKIAARRRRRQTQLPFEQT